MLIDVKCFIHSLCARYGSNIIVCFGLVETTIILFTNSYTKTVTSCINRFEILLILDDCCFGRKVLSALSIDDFMNLVLVRIAIG